MNSIGVAAAKHGRFSALLSDSACVRPLYDQVLLEQSGYVVAPTLGSIVPNWLLVIPRTPVLNMLHFREIDATDAFEIVGEVLSRLQISNERALWFEHGASYLGSNIGCGTDQAHIHILIDPPFSFSEFASTARRLGIFDWWEHSARKAYSSISSTSSYLLAASQDKAILAQNVDHAGSQFFRRLVANLAGRSNEWDYRLYPHIKNVEQTVQTFAQR